MATILADARRGHPGLFWFAVANVVLAVVLAGAAALDQRMLLGAPLWFKPLKFAISFAAYGGTLAWMLGQLRAPALRRTGWIIAITSAIEIAIIVGQAARGVRSHFNDDDATGITLFAVMGIAIVVLYLATVAVALRFLREPGHDRVMGTAIGLGLVVGLVGMAVGFLMSSVVDGHAVGVADGGPGLPMLGWSTTGGDLRIPHFVGMHALQLLPLVAAGLATLQLGAARRRLDDIVRRHVVVVAAVGYLGLVLVLTWQALRGQPLLAPDLPTLAALAALAVGVGVALRAVVRAAARHAALPQPV